MRETLSACIVLLGMQSIGASADIESTVMPPMCSPIPKARSLHDYYPPSGRMPEGTVVVEITIQASGKVSEAKVVRSSEPKLSGIALRAARAWTFESPKSACRAQIPIEFRNP